MGLAGLVTLMIATSGDEAFVMFALFPGKAFLLHLILLGIAIGTDIIVHLFSREKVPAEAHGFIVHNQENCRCFVK